MMSAYNCSINYLTRLIKCLINSSIIMTLIMLFFMQQDSHQLSFVPFSNQCCSVKAAVKSSFFMIGNGFL